MLLFFIKIIANIQKIIIKFKRFRKKTLTVLEKITKNKYIRELIGLDLVSGKKHIIFCFTRRKKKDFDFYMKTWPSVS